MNWNLKKTWPALATSIITFASMANADHPDIQMRNLENRVTALEQRKGSGGIINPPANPHVKDGDGVYFTADVFWWQSHENGLVYVFENTTDTTVLDGSARNPDFDYDFGFRVGVGSSLPYDGWDLHAYWTHFHNKAHNQQSLTLAGSEALIPTWVNPAAGTVLAGSSLVSAENHWRLHLNVIDFELGREFFVSKWLTLRPHMGVRTAWVRQKNIVDYTFASAVTTVVDEVDMKNRYWGVGLRTGVDTQWGLGEGFSFFGNFALSMLHGFFKVAQEEDVIQTGAIRLDMSDKYHLGRAVTDIQMGVRWETNFYSDAYHILFQAGWEHHMYFGQNQLLKFVNGDNQGLFTTNQGDLAIQGWTIAGRFDF